MSCLHEERTCIGDNYGVLNQSACKYHRPKLCHIHLAYSNHNKRQTNWKERTVKYFYCLHIFSCSVLQGYFNLAVRTFYRSGCDVS